MARPRKPTKLKIIEGNRGKRKLDLASEPQPVLGVPELKDYEAWRDAYARIVPELDRLGLVSVVDGPSLEAAFKGREQGQRADIQIAKLMAIIESGEGTQKDTYQLMAMNALSKKGWTQWGAYSQRFGLDPSSRGKLSVSAEKQADPVASVFFG